MSVFRIKSTSSVVKLAVRTTRSSIALWHFVSTAKRRRRYMRRSSSPGSRDPSAVKVPIPHPLPFCCTPDKSEYISWQFWSNHRDWLCPKVLLISFQCLFVSSCGSFPTYVSFCFFLFSLCSTCQRVQAVSCYISRILSSIWDWSVSAVTTATSYVREVWPGSWAAWLETSAARHVPRSSMIGTTRSALTQNIYL